MKCNTDRGIEFVSEDLVVYKLKILRVFKGRKLLATIRKTRAVLAVSTISGAQCGVRLRVGEVYLLNSGGVSASRKGFPKRAFRIFFCEPPVLWSSLAKAQKRFLAVNKKTNDSMCAGVP